MFASASTDNKGAIMCTPDSLNDDLLTALEGVVRVSDRQTVEFKVAHAVIARTKSALAGSTPPARQDEHNDGHFRGEG
jgi:hypothetical protein